MPQAPSNVGSKEGSNSIESIKVVSSAAGKSCSHLSGSWGTSYECSSAIDSSLLGASMRVGVNTDLLELDA